MFCKKCGKENDNDANFCIFCGNKIITKNEIIPNSKQIKEKNNISYTKEISNNKPNNYFIRCFFGYTLMLGGVIHLLAKELPAIGAISIGLLGFIISPILYNKLYGKKRLFLGIIFFIMTGLTGPCSTLHNQNKIQQKVSDKQNITIESQKATSIEAKQIIENKTKKQDSAISSNEKLPPLPTKIDVKIDVDKNNVSASYDKDVLDIIPLQKGKGWDKTLNQYGIEGVKKINALLPKAAEIMSKSNECDKLAYVAHSDRSTPNKIVIFGYCNNSAKFYLDETDIKNKISVISNKTKFEQMKYQLEEACNNIIKSRLNHPQTFDKSFARSSTYIGVNNIKITVGFTAKNSFNMELKHTAVCFFNDKPELVEFSIEEDR